MGGFVVGMTVLVVGGPVEACTVVWGWAVVPPTVVVCGWAVVGGAPVDRTPARQKREAQHDS